MEREGNAMGRPVSEWDETDLMKAVYGLRQHGLLTRAACSHMIGMILDGTSVAVAQFGRDFGQIAPSQPTPNHR